MIGKIILNLATSIDGYIADINDGYDWIVGYGKKELNTKETMDFQIFLESIDVVVMGKRCYDLNMHKDFQNKTVYIATNEKIEDYDNCKFIGEELTDVILSLKNEGKNIYLFGGGILIASFMKKDLIDEFIIGIVPVILGNGIRLFLDNNPTVNLTLDNYVVEDGITIMYYSRR